MPAAELPSGTTQRRSVLVGSPFMTTIIRRPIIVDVDGRLKVLPDGQTVPSSAFVPQIVTLDFGTIPVDGAVFTFAAPGAAVGAAVLMSAALDPSYDDDELEADGLLCAARCSATGTITAAITAVPGPITGTRKFAYHIGV